MQGLILASSNNFIPLEVNLDSTKVIHIINKGHLFYDAMVCKCRLMLAALGHPPVKHVYKEANRVADALVKEGVKQQRAENNFLVVSPVFVNEIL